MTGLGAVTPYGVGVPALWDGLLDAKPTAGRITRFDATGYPVDFACEVPAFEPSTYLPRRLATQLDLLGAFGLVAVAEALDDAGLATAASPEALSVPVTGADPSRVATVLGFGVGAVGVLAHQERRLLAGGPQRVRPYLAISAPPSMAAGQTALRHGLTGPCYGVASACVSATDALGQGIDLLRSGRADVVIAGGSEAPVVPVLMAAFASAGMLSRRVEDPATASRPFDAARDGLVCGEGAGVVVLERAEHTRRRGARPRALLTGYAASNDAYHATQPKADGAGAIAALRSALADARLHPDQVDHVNAHGNLDAGGGSGRGLGPARGVRPARGGDSRHQRQVGRWTPSWRRRRRRSGRGCPHARRAGRAANPEPADPRRAL